MNKDFEYLKKQLKGYEINWLDTDIISVTADEGVYKIVKDIISDAYLVEYIPNFGHIESSFHFTMSGVIEYIKGGDKKNE